MRSSGVSVRVRKILMDGKRHTLTEICTKVDAVVNTVQSRIADLRKPRYGNHKISTGREDGEFWYQMDPTPGSGAIHMPQEAKTRPQVDMASSRGKSIAEAARAKFNMLVASLNGLKDGSEKLNYPMAFKVATKDDYRYWLRSLEDMKRYLVFVIKLTKQERENGKKSKDRT